jgi:hypothetical protein
MKSTPLTTRSGLQIGSREPQQYSPTPEELHLQHALLFRPEKLSNGKIFLALVYFVTLVTGVIVVIRSWL